MLLLVEETLIFLNLHLMNASYDTKNKCIEGNESDSRIICGSERNQVIGKIFTFTERVEFYQISLKYLEKFDVHYKVPFDELSKSVKFNISMALKYFFTSNKKLFEKKNWWGISRLHSWNVS